ncbi:hemin-degrading factor [Arsenophonus nasoniae]|uniref:ChuX/HutX family heme-like substrate-binding protein n=1 Tax=Arsenophonus nasoniae TaxID=638 RepID=A0AA95GDT1_9GAMM|nr:ChuX/HutX family heme-like substrate-binding protein [Arsenophonus nasoniae]WGL94360.1 ChuX/HutX family heme-like substrate-binding protein [Arsenophonus nasoniae]
MNDSLYNRYQQAKQQSSLQSIAELANHLNVTEAELIYACANADDAKRLNVNTTLLLPELTNLGEIKAITANKYATHIHIGEFKNVRLNNQTGIVLNPRELDLRIFLDHWAISFALTETSSDNLQHSIQFFDYHGNAMHKIYATEKTNMAVWYKLINQYQMTTNPPLNLRPATVHPQSPQITQTVKKQLETDWRNMTNVHQFFQLLQKYNVKRQQIFAAVSDELAYQVDNHALYQILHSAFNQQNEIMIFVGSLGCMQIFTGCIQKLAAYHDKLSALQKINVLNPKFSLNVIETGIANSWVTRKPTKDGIVTSLEIFDHHGDPIIQLFGQRTEGEPEQLDWRKQISTLTKI